MPTKGTRTKTTGRTKISLWLDDDIVKDLDRLAEKGTISRSKLVQNIISESTKHLKACEKVGILQLSLLIRDMGESLSEWADQLRSKKINI